MAGRAHALAACALIGIALGAAASTASAAAVPELRAHVNDYARVLPSDRAAALEQRLAAYEQRSGQQFVLLTVDSLDGDPIEDFSIRVAERWKLGHKGKDDGLILVIAPSDRKMRIEVGYGLEGVIPDAIAARVVRDRLAPAFQRGDYAGGIDDAFSELMRAASGQAEPGAAPAPISRRGERRFLLGPLLLPLIVFLLLSLLGGRRGRGRRHGGFWVGSALGAGLGGGGFHGGGFGGGGGGFGGGGGGFGGGGGGFGGGGASGSW